MKRRLVLLALPMLAACATAGAAPAQLQDSRWTFVEIDGAAPVSGETTLAFHGSQIDAYLGCNGMGSEFRMVDGRLTVGPVISTQMYCDGVMDQEHAVGRLLASGPSYAVDHGKLTLAGGGHRAVLKRLD